MVGSKLAMCTFMTDSFMHAQIVICKFSQQKLPVVTLITLKYFFLICVSDLFMSEKTSILCEFLTTVIAFVPYTVMLSFLMHC